MAMVARTAADRVRIGRWRGSAPVRTGRAVKGLSDGANRPAKSRSLVVRAGPHRPRGAADGQPATSTPSSPAPRATRSA